MLQIQKKKILVALGVSIPFNKTRTLAPFNVCNLMLCDSKAFLAHLCGLCCPMTLEGLLNGSSFYTYHFLILVSSEVSFCLVSELVAELLSAHCILSAVIV